MAWHTAVKKTFYVTIWKTILIYTDFWTNNVSLFSLPILPSSNEYCGQHLAVQFQCFDLKPENKISSTSLTG